MCGHRGYLFLLGRYGIGRHRNIRLDHEHSRLLQILSAVLSEGKEDLETWSLALELISLHYRKVKKSSFRNFVDDDERKWVATMRISKHSGTILCKVLLQEFQKGCGREPDLTAMRATRWGICTAGKISHDFCGAIRALPSAEHQVSLPVCLSVLLSRSFWKRISFTLAENKICACTISKPSVSYSLQVWCGAQSVCHTRPACKTRVSWIK